MEIIYRSQGGKDPLGDILLTITDTYAKTPEQAFYRSLPAARLYNRRQGKHKPHCVTLQCGDYVADVKTGAIRSLSGALPAPLVPQPDLPLDDKSQPSLF